VVVVVVVTSREESSGMPWRQSTLPVRHQLWDHKLTSTLGS
jgi:hypothetical protein